MDSLNFAHVPLYSKAFDAQKFFSIPVIIGISVAGTFLVTLIFVLILTFCVYKKQKRKNQSNNVSQKSWLRWLFGAIFSRSKEKPGISDAKTKDHSRKNEAINQNQTNSLTNVPFFGDPNYAQYFPPLGVYSYQPVPLQYQYLYQVPPLPVYDQNYYYAFPPEIAPINSNITSVFPMSPQNESIPSYSSSTIKTANPSHPDNVNPNSTLGGVNNSTNTVVCANNLQDKLNTAPGSIIPSPLDRQNDQVPAVRSQTRTKPLSPSAIIKLREWHKPI